MTSVRPHLVHVNAAIIESTRTGSLMLDLGDDVAPSYKLESAVPVDGRAQGLSVTDLLECLTVPDQIAPLVVIDPPNVPGTTEAMRQLLLRNAFASDLFNIGGIMAILAMGLARGQQQEQMAFNFVNGLMEGRALSLIVDELRRMPGDAKEPWPLATAVFTHDVDYTLQPAAL
jgi:hypothetical protein